MKRHISERCGMVTIRYFFLGVLYLASPACGFSDPWGDNLRPKLHTDYLTQYSGKTLKKKTLVSFLK